MEHLEIPSSLRQLDASDFKTICRICLAKSKELRSIFQYSDKFSEKKEVDLSLKMKKVSAIEIHPNDKLPDKICVRCVNLLLISHYFKTLSEHSDARLRNILNMDVITHGKIKLEVLDEWEYELKLENDVIETLFEKNDLNNKAKSNENIHIDESNGNIVKIGECNVKIYSTKSNVSNKVINDTAETHHKEYNIGDLDDRYIKKEEQSIEELHDMDDTNVDDSLIDSDVSSKYSDMDESKIKQNTLSKGIKILPLESDAIIKNNKIMLVKQKIRPLDGTVKEEKFGRKSDKGTRGMKLKKKILPLNKSDEKRLKTLCEMNAKNKTDKKIIKKMPELLKIVKQKILPVGARVEEPEVNNENSGCYECLICGLRYGQSFLLHRHMTVYHKKKKEYKCYGCDLKFKTKTERSFHEMKQCPNMKPGTQYHCKECDTSFEERCLYDVHMEKHAPPSTDTLEIDDLLKCPDCNYTTSKRSLLNTHIKCKHEMAGKDYVCETCGKHYTNRNTFVSHKTMHRPPSRVFKCRYCDYSTRYGNGIKSHERTHTREYRYTCELCGKNFITNSALHMHRRRHAGIREHQCKLCDKNYARKFELRCHVESVHDKIRPYKCSVCSAAFYQRMKCHKHMRNVHKIASPNVPSLVQRRKVPY